MKPGILLSGILLLSAGSGAYAVDTNAAIGGAVGGAVGAIVGSELGGRDGAIAGSAVGAAVGTAVATDGNQDHRHSSVTVESGYRNGGPPAHAYKVPPGHAKHKKKNKW